MQIYATTCLILNIEHLLGIRLGLFTPDLAFEVVAKNQIQQLKKPCLTVTELVAGELSKVAKSAFEKVFYSDFDFHSNFLVSQLSWSWACSCCNLQVFFCFVSTFDFNYLIFVLVLSCLILRSIYS